MFLGLFGSYGKNDSVDVQYRLGGPRTCRPPGWRSSRPTNLDTLVSRFYSARMRIDEILEQRRPVFSFEFFPPKTEEGQRTLEVTLGQLQDDRPDYVSMTYGAGGATRNATVELTKWIKQDLGIEAMAHLSCVGEPTERLVEILDEIQAAGIENVLALRGDPPRGETEWTAAPGRAQLLRRADPADRASASTSASAPPASPRCTRTRPTARATCATRSRSRRPAPSFLITQLFFDNELYFDFVEQARAAGITVPIVPGIMPITNYGQIKRFTEMCGASIPDELERELERARRRPGSGCGARGRLRDPPVLRSPGAGRARDPLLHAQPLARNAGDPGRAARGAPVDARRRDGLALGRQRTSARARSSATGATSPAQLQVAQVAERLGQPPADHHRRCGISASSISGTISNGVRGPSRARARTRSTRSCTARRFASTRRGASRTGRPWPASTSCTSSPSTTSRLRQELAGRVGRVAEVVVERDPPEQVVARQQQPALGLVEDHVRGRVAGRLVDLPGAEVGLHLHARQQVAVGHHELGDPEALPARAPRLASASASAGTPLWRATSKRRSKRALGILRRPGHVRVVGVHPELAARRARRSAPPARSGPSGRGCRPAAARARAAGRPGRAPARAGAARPARAGRCPPAPRRPPRRSRTRSRAARPARAAAGAAATARAAPGRRAPARASAAWSRVDQHARVEDARAGRRRALAARSAAANGSGRWRSYQGRWSRPTAWWWVIVPPAAIDRLGRRRLDLVPLLELGAAPGRRQHREVGRRAVGVDVGEAAGHARPSGRAPARRARAPRPRTRRSGPR